MHTYIHTPTEIYTVYIYMYIYIYICDRGALMVHMIASVENKPVETEGVEALDDVQPWP